MNDHSRTLWQHLADKIFSPATQAYWHTSRRAGQPLGKTLHGYIYARWPALYLGLLMGRHPLARPLVWVEGWMRRKGLVTPDTYARFVEGYHGKVLEPGAARQLIAVQKPVDATLPEKMLPYSRARDIVLEAGDDVALMECPCRASKEKHCLPLDVCIVVGKVMVDFIVTHHKHKARRVTSDEALEVIRQSQRRGHAAHAFFKDAVLNRFYTICNCCSCCCAAIESHRCGTPTLASSGLVARTHSEKCTGCGLCLRRCPFGAIQMQHSPETKEAKAVVNETACMGCGVCTFNCPSLALTLEAQPERGMPLDIHTEHAASRRARGSA